MPEFHENWYSDSQLTDLRYIVRAVKHLEGDFVEIGCWEGRSTIVIAEECAPETLHAVDHWLGNIDEGEHHQSVRALAERDVYGTFLKNIEPFPNVEVHKADGIELMEGWERPIKFAHLDAGHTYEATAALIRAVLPHIVPGGYMCGDDYLTSHIGMAQFNGGVQRAVGELLRFHLVDGNLWFWTKPMTPEFGFGVDAGE